MSNFLVRPRYFIFVDLRAAGVISLAVCILTAVTGHWHEVMQIMPVILNVVFFSLLFSIYHVGMYHILQPYDGQMKVKIPMFTATNILVGVFGVIFWQLPLNAISVLSVQLIGVTALFVFCFIMVKEFGVENFHVK